MTAPLKTPARTVRCLQARERILGAAIAEFKQAGMAGAEVSAIVDAAGVAHGTFYFHLPTEEHVLFELESREEARVPCEFARFTKTPHNLSAALCWLRLSNPTDNPASRERSNHVALGMGGRAVRSCVRRNSPDHPVLVLDVQDAGYVLDRCGSTLGRPAARRLRR